MKKNIKIPERMSVKILTPIHLQLKEFCDKKGLKIQKFLEILIINNCKED